MKERVLKVLEEILKSSGYRVKPEGDEIVAENDSIFRLRYLDDGIVNDEGVVHLTLRELSHEEREKFRRLGLTVWDRDRIMYEIGRAVVLDLEGKRWEIEVDKGIPSGSEVIFIKSYPVRYRQEEVRRTSIGEVGGITDVRLKFVPHWKYSFRLHHVRRVKGNTLEIKEEGEGLMNAVNGFFDEPLNAKIMDSIEVSGEYQIDTTRIDKEDAKEKIMDELISKYTRRLKMKRETGDSFIVDTVVIKPSPKDVNVDLELVYIPVWEVSGKKGTAFYSATTGELLEMPADDDVEILS